MTYRQFEDGEVFDAADAQLLMDQGVIHVASQTEQNQIPAPSDGMVIYRDDLKVLLRRISGVWRVLSEYLSVADQSERDALPAHDGLTVYRRDIDAIARFDGFNWIADDSGWVTIETIGSGWNVVAGAAPRIRRVGKRIDLVGMLSYAGGSATDVLTIPEGFRRLSGTALVRPVGITISSNGIGYMIQLDPVTHRIGMVLHLGSVNPTTVPIQATWYVD